MKKYLLFIATVGAIILNNNAGAQSAKNQPELSASASIESEEVESGNGANPELSAGSSVSTKESTKNKAEKEIIRKENTVPTLSNAGSKIDFL